MPEIFVDAAGAMIVGAFVIVGLLAVAVALYNPEILLGVLLFGALLSFMWLIGAIVTVFFGIQTSW